MNQPGFHRMSAKEFLFPLLEFRKFHLFFFPATKDVENSRTQIQPLMYRQIPDSANG